MSASADIIPFPARPVPAGSAGARAPGADAGRLSRALTKLDLALAEQRAAVAVWQDGLVTLGGSLAGLDGSLRRYGDRLAGLRARTETVHAQAQRLEAWADAVLSGPAHVAPPVSRAGSR
jgi:hypothetical protein